MRCTCSLTILTCVVLISFMILGAATYAWVQLILEHHPDTHAKIYKFREHFRLSSRTRRYIDTPSDPMDDLATMKPKKPDPEVTLYVGELLKMALPVGYTAVTFDGGIPRWIELRDNTMVGVPGPEHTGKVDVKVDAGIDSYSFNLTVAFEKTTVCGETTANWLDTYYNESQTLSSMMYFFNTLEKRVPMVGNSMRAYSKHYASVNRDLEDIGQDDFDGYVISWIARCGDMKEGTDSMVEFLEEDLTDNVRLERGFFKKTDPVWEEVTTTTPSANATTPMTRKPSTKPSTKPTVSSPKQPSSGSTKALKLLTTTPQGSTTLKPTTNTKPFSTPKLSTTSALVTTTEPLTTTLEPSKTREPSAEPSSEPPTTTMPSTTTQSTTSLEPTTTSTPSTRPEPSTSLGTTTTMEAEASTTIMPLTTTTKRTPMPMVPRYKCLQGRLCQIHIMQSLFEEGGCSKKDGDLGVLYIPEKSYQHNWLHYEGNWTFTGVPLVEGLVTMTLTKPVGRNTVLLKNIKIWVQPEEGIPAGTIHMDLDCPPYEVLMKPTYRTSLVKLLASSLGGPETTLTFYDFTALGNSTRVSFTNNTIAPCDKDQFNEFTAKVFNETDESIALPFLYALDERISIVELAITPIDPEFCLPRTKPSSTTDAPILTTQTPNPSNWGIFFHVFCGTVAAGLVIVFAAWFIYIHCIRGKFCITNTEETNQRTPSVVSLQHSLIESVASARQPFELPPGIYISEAIYV